MIEYYHYPVMLKEAVDNLLTGKDLIYVDATLGGGGYSQRILDYLSNKGLLFSFDVDDDAIKFCSEKFKNYKNSNIIKSSHEFVKSELSNKFNLTSITGGIVYDFGASTHQFKTKDRGFSFNENAKLDMRFNMSSDFSAYDVVNFYSENDLVRIFSEYGEERFSRRIAKAICETRKLSKIEATDDLVNIILKSTPKIKSKIHPATRVFQAIRIEVNDELNVIRRSLENVLPFLEIGARIVCVSFHSAEDRIVKQFFKANKDKLNVITKKPLCASDGEIKENPPSRSAKLRVAEVTCK